MELTALQARIVGALVEKQLTTPQQYPLTLNALVAACNQASNRDPVTDYGDDDVLGALGECKAAGLVRFVLPSHGRSAVRYRQVLDEVLGLDPPQLAVLGVLLLRGPQTVGELRLRTDRMAGFDTLEAVEHELGLLAGRDEPLVVRLERRPGQKEERWSDLLQPERPVSEPVVAVPAPGPRDRLEELAAQIASLREEVAALAAALAELRSSLGG